MDIFGLCVDFWCVCGFMSVCMCVCVRAHIAAGGCEFIPLLCKSHIGSSHICIMYLATSGWMRCQEISTELSSQPITERFIMMVNFTCEQMRGKTHSLVYYS